MMAEWGFLTAKGWLAGRLDGWLAEWGFLAALLHGWKIIHGASGVCYATEINVQGAGAMLCYPFLMPKPKGVCM